MKIELERNQINHYRNLRPEDRCEASQQLQWEGLVQQFAEELDVLQISLEEKLETGQFDFSTEISQDGWSTRRHHLFVTILDQINTLGPTKSPPEVTAQEVQVETHKKPKTYPQRDQAYCID